ncbi:unnamed protein product [Diatraea saccharalis]|uniref:Catalase core domain-containing protein n=1 Tax=Diatraea saccharalis TaxID=40085 RepID=A0A9N9RBY4_9NEOP|nr:unnamed protein product [Diatraea saccharalis]
MRVTWSVFVCCILVQGWEISEAYNRYSNVTIDRASRQLREFKDAHPKPIGIITTEAGVPVDIRDTITLNSDIFNSEFFSDTLTHFDGEPIPERVVHAQGHGAYGYFEVTNDVSKYTSADVFNGIGKKTPVFGRFSTARSSINGNELGRDHKGLAVKMYTKEGNLDFLCVHIPVYDYRDPLDFASFARSTRQNPKTNIPDPNMNVDFALLRPTRVHAIMWRLSDYGIPLGYRRMDIFPIHTYELHNEQGERFFAKFSFRTELGLANLTTAQAVAISIQDPTYFTRDLYNAIANKNYPSWRLEMDIMSYDDVKKLNYNPFDVTRIWTTGTYKTVTIGRLVMDENIDNHFSTAEQSAFNPANVVPGIPGPVDTMFRGRRLAYRDTQNHRLGRNHNKIDVNLPKQQLTYTRDSDPPVRDNMGDAPSFFPNSFNGPVPYVNPSRPSEKLFICEHNVIDFAPAWFFYNYILRDDASRQRLADNIGDVLRTVDTEITERGITMFSWIDEDLGRRIAASLTHNDIFVRDWTSFSSDRTYVSLTHSDIVVRDWTRLFLRVEITTRLTTRMPRFWRTKRLVSLCKHPQQSIRELALELEEESSILYPPTTTGQRENLCENTDYAINTFADFTNIITTASQESITGITGATQTEV